MPLAAAQLDRIENLLITRLRSKLQRYTPEPSSMPFHARLIGHDYLALFSFVQSLNTNFGTAIFEPVALELAHGRFKVAKRQIAVGDKMSHQAQQIIQEIVDGLTTAALVPNKTQEIEMIRAVCQVEPMVKVNPTRVDIWIEAQTRHYYLFDVKTAKPNAGQFREFKRTLLEWVAVILAQDPHAQVHTAIAIPYNPYEPKPYSRWTIRGMLDLREELYVAQEFWDFLGGQGAYEELLGVFQEVGQQMRPEIDKKFADFR